MNIHTDNEKAREKVFTELRIAKQEELLAASTTREKATAVTKHIIEELKIRLNNAAGQRFAVAFEGTFPFTMAYGPRINKADLTSFKTVYAGILSTNPGEHMTGEEPTSLNAYEVSTSKLFSLGKGIIIPDKEFIPASGLWLKYYERDHPAWNLTDIAAALAPGDIKEILKPKDPRSTDKGEINVRFWIGNTEFDTFITTLKPKTAEHLLVLINEEPSMPAA